ncbi:MAG: radical SAM protein [Candidatus Pacearchaeota archaeon]|nr:radical SAM protein [Candidatus Pacearchaeota archaeon]
MITRKCNLNCSFCKIKRANRLKNELNLEEWKKGLKKLENIGIKSIQILGGEPTTSTWLEDLIIFLNNETNLFYSIESNSTFEDKRFNSLLNAGIKGYCGDINIFNFAQKKDWYAIKANKGLNMLLRMKKSGVPYIEASIIINRRNIKEISFIVKKLSKRGIYSNLIPVHYGNAYKWEFRAEDIADEFKIKKEDKPLVERTMNELIKMKEQGFKIINKKNILKILPK